MRNFLFSSKFNLGEHQKLEIKLNEDKGSRFPDLFF